MSMNAAISGHQRSTVSLDPAQGVEQFRRYGRFPLGEFTRRQGRPSARDDVFSSVLEEDFAERNGLTGVGIGG
ncbi:hypothetical protein SCWH03_58150 [Streptomyces pacificus]|uniref:Uncharacterized protein n=1 Tax=Streptomyces pacificus TaxID=2705029 RepID=A0A6A0B727_9ACTN|nr:hypothetical protein SCWH03_58150 [Streptomyces pacificus]